MTTCDIFFERSAKLNLQRVRPRWKPEVQVQEAMIHGLQRQRESNSAIRLGTSRRGWSTIPLNVSFDLRETCHRTYGHKGPGCHDSAATLGRSTSLNCKS